MSIIEGQQLKSSSNSKTFAVSCFWKEITCSDEDQEDTTESGIPTKTHSRKPGTQCSQLARGCRWAAGLRELLLRLHTAICLYPSRKTGPQSHYCIWCSHLLPTVHRLSPTLERNFSRPSGYEHVFMFILRQVALSCSQTMCLQGWSAIEGIRYTTYSHFFPQLPEEHWGNLEYLPLFLG